MHSDEACGPAQPLVRTGRGPGTGHVVVRPQSDAETEAWPPAEYGHLCYRLGRLEALVDLFAADLRALCERFAR